MTWRERVWYSIPTMRLTIGGVGMKFGPGFTLTLIFAIVVLVVIDLQSAVPNFVTASYPAIARFAYDVIEQALAIMIATFVGFVLGQKVGRSEATSKLVASVDSLVKEIREDRERRA